MHVEGDDAASQLIKHSKLRAIYSSFFRTNDLRRDFELTPLSSFLSRLVALGLGLGGTNSLLRRGLLRAVRSEQLVHFHTNNLGLLLAEEHALEAVEVAEVGAGLRLDRLLAPARGIELVLNLSRTIKGEMQVRLNAPQHTNERAHVGECLIPWRQRRP